MLKRDKEIKKQNKSTEYYQQRTPEIPKKNFSSAITFKRNGFNKNFQKCFFIDGKVGMSYEPTF